MKAVVESGNGCATADVVIDIVDPRNDPAWDRATGTLAEWGPFHAAGWALALADTYDFVPMYLVAKVDGRVAGLLPLMEVRSRWTGTRGVSLPFTDTCPVLAETPAVRDALIRQAVEPYRERSWKYLELRDGCIPLPGGLPSDEYVEHTLSLASSEAGLWEACHPSARRAVRKAEAGGVRASIEDSVEAVREYYALHVQTRKRHGVPPQPWTFFANLHRHMIDKNGGFVCLARLDGRPVAGAVFLMGGGRAVFKFGASNAEGQAVRGSNLAMWSGIKACHGRACATLSFGRTAEDQEGLRRFKRHWGAQEQIVKYFRVQQGRSGHRPAHAGDQGWVSRALRHCPTPIARAAGSLLYRHMA